jgi:hypothetical protein
MIVEQRIGRVQRLASEHAHVSIFNIMLRGTFEEYIVGRLMEKLQMAAHAIGDIEALLQGADIADGDEDGATTFEDRILKLVLAALAGKDVEAETRLAETSIEEAKAELEREEANINTMLGSMDGVEYVGPRAPTLPGVIHSMQSRDFTLAALQTLGFRLDSKAPDLYVAEQNGAREYIRFEEHAAAGIRSTLYAPGSGAFQRLVDRVIASGVHDVDDLDHSPAKESEEIARKWVEGFGAKPESVELGDIQRSFGGTALVRVRTTVAHDSYERLVEIPCAHNEHRGGAGPYVLAPLAKTIENPATLGLDIEKLITVASQDEAISEFSRFYLERREQETQAAAGDERKRKRLYDEFTPRLEMTLVGLQGNLYREIKVRARYTFDSEPSYESLLTIAPYRNEVTDGPKLGLCSKSGRRVPTSCLAKCEITGADVLRHLLVKSDISGRLALPEFSAICSLSSKRVLKDELEASSVTGRLVASALLKTSALSGKRAEPAHFALCAFTKAELLNTELVRSEISGKPYRVDQQMRSTVSGKAGHKQEFIFCQETDQPIAPEEAERCEVTGKQVRPGILETCEITGKRVLPSALERCAATGKRALKRLLVTSSRSQARILEAAAIRSSAGKFCTPSEARTCFWSGHKSHPDDLRTCALTRLPINVEFATAEGAPRLRPLVEMLDGVRRTADETRLWDSAAAQIGVALNGRRCQVKAAVLSPAKQHLATCSEVRTFLGIRVHQVGAVYDLTESTVVGRLAVGKRGTNGWIERTR